MFCFPLSFSLLLFEEHLKEWTISSTGHYCQMNLLSLFRLNGSLEPGLPALGNAAKVMYKSDYIINLRFFFSLSTSIFFIKK